MAISDAEAAAALLLGRWPFDVEKALHAYGVIIVSAERTATGGVEWVQVERVATGGTRTRHLASGPGGHGFWEQHTAPDGQKVWRLIRPEFFLPWRNEGATYRYVQRAVFWELYQEWVA